MLSFDHRGATYVNIYFGGLYSPPGLNRVKMAWLSVSGICLHQGLFSFAFLVATVFIGSYLNHLHFIRVSINTHNFVIQ